MKDKISKLKNLVKKYGLAGTIKKAAGYIYSNYLVKLSVKERIYVAVNKKKFIEGIDRILSKNSYDRIVIWRSSFGWDVPLYQRPQHIFSNFAKQRTLVFYEVTRFTDDVKRIKKQADNLYHGPAWPPAGGSSSSRRRPCEGADSSFFAYAFGYPPGSCPGSAGRFLRHHTTKYCAL